MGRGENPEPFDFDVVRFGLFEDEWSWASSDPSPEIRQQLTGLENALSGYTHLISRDPEPVEKALHILRDHRSTIGDESAPAIERLLGATTLALIRDSGGEVAQGYARRFLNGLMVEPTDSDLIAREPGGGLHVLSAPFDEEATRNETLCGRLVGDDWAVEWPRGTFMKAVEQGVDGSTVQKVLGEACSECHHALKQWSVERATDDDSALAASAGLEPQDYPVLEEAETKRLLAAAAAGLTSFFDSDEHDAEAAAWAARNALGKELRAVVLERIDRYDPAELVEIMLDDSLYKAEIERFVSPNDPPSSEEWENALALVDMQHLQLRLPDRIWPQSANGFSERQYCDETLAALAALRIRSTQKVEADDTLGKVCKQALLAYCALIEHGVL